MVPKVDVPEKPAASGPVIEASPGHPHKSRVDQRRHQATDLAGGLSAALNNTDKLREDYYKDLRGVAVSRSWGSLSLLGAAAWAAASGLQPGATDADTTRALRLGVASSTGYLISDFFTNRKHEEAYAQGYRKLTCLVVQSLPLQWPEGKRSEKTRNGECTAADSQRRSNTELRTCIKLASCGTPEDHHRCAAISALNNTADLSAALEDLNHVINLEHNGLSLALAELALMPFLSDQLKLVQRDALRQREFALRLARSTLKEGRVMLSLIESSGDLLTGRAGLVSAWVNLEVAAGQNNIPRPTLGPTTPADLLPTLTPVGAEAEAQSKSPDNLLGREQQPKSGSTGSMPASDSATTGSEAARTPTVEDLAALEKRLIALAIDPTERRREREKLATERTRNTEIRKLKTELENLKKKSALRGQAELATGPCTKDNSACNLRQWANGTDRLHQFRRPVAQALIDFREKTKTVSAVAACGGERAKVVIAPETDQVLTAPTEAEFIVSTESGVTPRLSLSGNAGIAAPDKALTVTIVDGTVIAKVKVGAKAPAGSLVLTATDNKGGGSQSVLLVVKPREGNDSDSLPDFLR